MTHEVSQQFNFATTAKGIGYAGQIMTACPHVAINEIVRFLHKRLGRGVPVPGFVLRSVDGNLTIFVEAEEPKGDKKHGYKPPRVPSSRIWQRYGVTAWQYANA